MALTSIEVCAGAGGQALGLERAGFHHVACVEIDKYACETLRLNRKEQWNVIEADLRSWSPDEEMRGVSLLAGGVPCPPFSVAGRQLGADDERDLFPELIRLTGELDPRAVMIENVKGLLSTKFDPYRENIKRQFRQLGYVAEWRLLEAADYGVPQLRPRSIMIALRPADYAEWRWPTPDRSATPSVGEALLESMQDLGLPRAVEWAAGASGVAPTLVGGSKKHGGADLGPTRAKQQWRERFGVDGLGVRDEGHRYDPDFTGMPRLTVQQAALIQGFPPEWRFSGRKTASYRQVGNAFPPPVAEAVGRRLVAAFRAADAAEDAQADEPLSA